MKSTLIIALILFTLFNSKFTFAQEFLKENSIQNENPNKGKFDPKRLSFGGGLGLQFGSETLISIAPEVAYWFTDKFRAGIGLSYYYYSFSSSQYSYSTSIYGAKVFGSYSIFENLMTYAEYEVLNLETNYLYQPSNRIFIGNLLAGPGYRFKAGGRSSICLLLLWNINTNQYSPYSNPIMRLSFEF